MNLNRKNRQYFLIILIILSFLGITTFLIIQLRKIRRKLELQNLQLNDLNQTKDRFFGIIAHDIRSPIIALESVEEQVKYYANKKDLAKVFKISSMISQTARQLNGLLDNLLNWSFLQTRSIQYRPEKINLNEITQEVIELFRQNAIAKEIQVKTTIDPSLSVKADKNALHTVIRNLLSNAIKFTPEGGLITLKAKQINHEIHLQTIDKGVGLSPDQIEKLFDLGNRSGKGTAGEKGTGLGLILCRELLEQNHGALLIESKKDEGSVFTAVLPAA
ncbi:MAG: HAMP domain-containing histidine kinase [Saprospiraceae bacterium]|nr:HAMP domain-containing histidine kinase [Saprospiraceae bacterium]